MHDHPNSYLCSLIYVFSMLQFVINMVVADYIL
jgi:hypothetical protein